MHYSAKRGLAIVCCASVCLSVVLVYHDYILKILENNCADKRLSTYS